MKKLILLITIFISTLSFSQEAIFINGKIKVYNQVPKVWELPSGEKITNFKSSTNQQRYSLGFRPLENPTITKYQRLDTLYFDTVNDVFTRSIKNFTQEEIDVYDQNQIDSDSSAIKTDKYIQDGQMYNKRIWDRIMRGYDSGNITSNQFNAISNTLFDAILPMYYGRWKIAKSRVDATPDPNNAKLLAIKRKVQKIIDDYIAENY